MMPTLLAAVGGAESAVKPSIRNRVRRHGTQLRDSRPARPSRAPRSRHAADLPCKSRASPWSRRLDRRHGPRPGAMDDRVFPAMIGPSHSRIPASISRKV